MEPGERCICQHPDWHSAFGNVDYTLEIGQRLTVKQTSRVGAAIFYYFEETPDDCCFLSIGFKPLRSLN